MRAWDSEPLAPKQQAELRQAAIALRENRHAEKLLTRIQASELSAESVVRLLRWIIFWDSQTKTAGKAKMTERLAKTTGKSLRTLKYFPEKVESLAQEIECVNSSALFDQRLLPHPFFALAEDLRRYAKLTRDCISEWEAYLQKCKKGWSAQGTEAMRFLVRTVRQTTGKPRFEEIADLLTEAATVFGVNAQYDADLIKMRVRRKIPNASPPDL